MSGGEAQFAAPEPPQVDEFVDGGVETVSQLAIGDAVDLPSDSAGIPVTPLVALRVEPATVPGDVVHLDRPLDRRIGSVGMDQCSRRQPQRELSNEGLDPAPFEGIENTQLESGSLRTLPVRSLAHHTIDAGEPRSAALCQRPDLTPQCRHA